MYWELNELKHYNHFLLILILFLLSSLLLVGCDSPKNANLVAIDFYDLIVKQTTNPSLIEVGFPEEVGKTTIDHIKTTLEKNIQSALTTDDGIAITDAQLQSLTDAYLSAIHRLKATARVISYENSKSCTVELSTSYLNYKAIDENAVKVALETINISTYKDEKLYLQDLMNIYIDELIKGYQIATPSTDFHTQTFEFKLENKVWIPVDYTHFLSSICTMIAANDPI